MLKHNLLCFWGDTLMQRVGAEISGARFHRARHVGNVPHSQYATVIDSPIQRARFCLTGTFFFVAMLAASGNPVFSAAGRAEAAHQQPPSQHARGSEGDRGTDDEPRLRINTGGHTASVRALAFSPDSSRLYSAGLDKIVQIWNLKTVTRDLTGNYLRERTIRWEVARGLRGNIYAMAAAPSDGLLAWGGFGARTNTGLILLVDPVSG